MKIQLITLLAFSFLVSQQTNAQSKQKVTGDDIVLVNFGFGDRAFIGNLLSEISKCNPAVIGINAWFTSEKTPELDNALVQGFKDAQNDILAFSFRPDGSLSKSHEKFGMHVTSQGFPQLGGEDGVISSFVPLMTEQGKPLPHFAVEIAKAWDPELTIRAKSDIPIPIKFSRDLDEFVTIEGDQFSKEKHGKILKNKIVLLGYLGPQDNDKFFTKYSAVVNEEPNMYGTVIIANQILTLFSL